MKISVRRKNAEAGPDMTPFIDVVFLLIVFFMTVSRFAQQEYEEVQLPEAHQAQEKLPRQKTKVVLNVAADGATVVANRTLSLRDLRRRLTQEVKLNGGPENVIVLVRADREVAYEKVQHLMMACAAAGVWQISFAVVEEARP